MSSRIKDHCVFGCNVVRRVADIIKDTGAHLDRENVSKVAERVSEGVAVITRILPSVFALAPWNGPLATPSRGSDDDRHRAALGVGDPSQRRPRTLE